MPLQKKNRVDTESIISDSLIKMRELIKNDLRSVEKSDGGKKKSRNDFYRFTLEGTINPQ